MIGSAERKILNKENISESMETVGLGDLVEVLQIDNKGVPLEDKAFWISVISFKDKQIMASKILEFKDDEEKNIINDDNDEEKVGGDSEDRDIYYLSDTENLSKSLLKKAVGNEFQYEGNDGNIYFMRVISVEKLSD